MTDDFWRELCIFLFWADSMLSFVAAWFLYERLFMRPINELVNGLDEMIETFAELRDRHDD